MHRGSLFTSPAYLDALEQSGCASVASGWRRRAEAPLAAGPFYDKRHSWGEFVFDFAWARAHAQLGLEYYPKLVGCVPFTPVPGPRLPAPDDASRRALAQAVEDAVRAEALSGAHLLFLPEAEARLLAARGWLLRDDLHFVWHNPGDASFAAFLARLAGRKRRNIQRERAQVRAHGLALEWCAARDVAERDWEPIFRLYARTYAVRGQAPYFNAACLRAWARALPDTFLLCLARRSEDPAAVAFFFREGDTLYGRHWGSDADYPLLHFELCYYQGIDYCIAHGLQRFDAGIQGEYKLARGFAPVRTRSAHWLAHPGLRGLIAAAVRQENAAVDAELAASCAHSPYREPTGIFAQPGPG